MSVSFFLPHPAAMSAFIICRVVEACVRVVANVCAVCAFWV